MPESTNPSYSDPASKIRRAPHRRNQRGRKRLLLLHLMRAFVLVSGMALGMYYHVPNNAPAQVHSSAGPVLRSNPGAPDPNKDPDPNTTPEIQVARLPGDSLLDPNAFGSGTTDCFCNSLLGQQVTLVAGT